MPRRIYLMLAAVLAGVAPWLHAQDQKAEIQKRLTSEFTLTKPTADKSDIATAGAVLVLHKSGLLMYSVSNPIPPQSTYKKGKITRNAFGKNFWRDFGNTMVTPGSSVDIVQRNFVDGEKFWVTKVDVKDDGVIFGLYSDPYDGVRYFGELKFPLPRGPVPADDVLKTIEEVLTVQPADDSSASAAQPQAPSLLPTDAPPAPPKTIALGQTKDQVVANFGQPQKIVNLGTKEMYYYPDMKVTFVNGKITDVQ